jgi:hypothetical protein
MAPAHRTSIWDRTIAHPRPWWVTLVLAALVYLPTLLAAGAFGMTDLSSQGARAILAPPTIIVYILILGPVMAPLEAGVFRALRPLALVDEAELDAGLNRARTVPLWQELASVAVGLVFGLLLIGLPEGEAVTWPNLVVVVTGYTMLGLLGWTAFMSIAGTRVLNALLHFPLRVDPLDRKPFEPIGRWALGIAMAFVGGILIGLILGSYGTDAVRNPRFWLLFLPLSLLPVLVFYLTMRPTHRVLATARDRALDEVQRELRRTFPTLLGHMQRGEPTGNLPWEVNALVAYEKELDQASTWPYNPVILRTLIVSVLIPTVTLLARRVFEVYIG